MNSIINKGNIKGTTFMALSAVVAVLMGGCGSDSGGGVIRPLPSNKSGVVSHQHHPGQGPSPATGGDASGSQTASPGSGQPQ